MIADFSNRSKRCPHCADRAPVAARHCPRCGNIIPRRSTPFRKPLFAALAILPTIACAFLLLVKPLRPYARPSRNSSADAAVVVAQTRSLIVALRAQQEEDRAELADLRRRHAELLDRVAGSRRESPAVTPQTTPPPPDPGLLRSVAQLRQQVREMTAEVQTAIADTQALRALADHRERALQQTSARLAAYREAALSADPGARWSLLRSELDAGASLPAHAVVKLLGPPAAEQVTGIDLRGRMLHFTGGGTVHTHAGIATRIVPPAADRE